MAAPTPTDETRPTARAAAWSLALCAVTCVIASGFGLRFYGDTGFLFRELSDPEFPPAGLATALSGALLLWAGWSWLALGRAASQRSALGLGACLLWFGFDEVLELHERATRAMVDAGLPRPFGIEQDVYLFALYAAVALPCLLLSLPRVRADRTALRLVALALVLAATSQAADLLPWDRLSRTERQWVGPLEEGTKTLSVLALALASARLRNSR